MDLTIQIPESLRKDMMPHDGEVDWSAVAAEAFRFEIFKLEASSEYEVVRKTSLVKKTGIWESTFNTEINIVLPVPESTFKAPKSE